MFASKGFNKAIDLNYSSEYAPQTQKCSVGRAVCQPAPKSGAWNAPLRLPFGSHLRKPLVRKGGA